jgi:hypothetical protein
VYTVWDNKHPWAAREFDAIVRRLYGGDGVVASRPNCEPVTRKERNRVMDVITFRYRDKVYSRRPFKHGCGCVGNKCAFIKEKCFELMWNGDVPKCVDVSNDHGWCYDEVTTPPRPNREPGNKEGKEI